MKKNQSINDYSKNLSTVIADQPSVEEISCPTGYLINKLTLNF